MPNVKISSPNKVGSKFYTKIFTHRKMEKYIKISAAVIEKWIRAHIGKIHSDSYKLFK